ncbi:MAG TPA: SCO family protein [Hyphomicrobiales bacterium]|nr:SCO family protein [Hyphomicrobiales bacterium]
MVARIAFIVVIAFSIGMGIALFLRHDAQQGGVVQSGKALIGGEFSLTNQKGEPVTDKDFHGKYMLVSFGYTFCPDVCPAELQLMTDAMDKLGDKQSEVVPVFVTIDPARDTVEKMRDYVSNFHPRMVGLTGTEEQIKQAAEAYHVFYAKTETEKADDQYYLMDHSAFIYLMDRNGQYLRHFPYGTNADDLAAAISKEISASS